MTELPELPAPLTTEESLLHGIALRLDVLIASSRSGAKAKAEPVKAAKPAARKAAPRKAAAQKTAKRAR